MNDHQQVRAEGDKYILFIRYEMIFDTNWLKAPTQIILLITDVTVMNLIYLIYKIHWIQEIW